MKPIADEPMPGSDSGEAHAICGAKTRSGEPCRQRPMLGQRRCRMHGGSSPVALRAAERRIASVEAARQVEVWGGRLDVNPAEALLELVQSKAAEVAYWNHRVAGLDEAERAGLLVAETTFGEGPQGPVDTVTRKASPHVFVVLLHKAQDQLASFSAAALRAGVDEALVRLATVQAAAVVEFARRAIEVSRERPDVAADVILLELVGGGVS